jgi:hypothetical protein
VRRFRHFRRTSKPDLYALTDLRARGHLYGEQKAQRSTVGLEVRIRPVAVIFCLKNVAEKPHLGAHAWRDLVRNGSHVEEGLMRRHEFRELRSLMRSIGSLYNAGRTRAFSQRMMNAEADPVAEKRRVRLPVHRERYVAGLRADNHPAPPEIDAALLVNCVEYDSESTAPHVQGNVLQTPRRRTPVVVPHCDIDALYNLDTAKPDMA